MKVRRRPHWGQDNPRDQVRAILGGIAGDVHNMLQGIGDKETQCHRIIKHLVDCEDILHDMDENEWEEIEAQVPLFPPGRKR